MKKRAKELFGKVKGSVSDLRDQVAEQASDAAEMLDPDVLKGGIAVLKDKVEDGLRNTPLQKFLPAKPTISTPSENQLEARRQAEGGYKRAEGHVSPQFGDPAGDHNSLAAVASDAMAERDPKKQPRKSPAPSAATKKVQQSSASGSGGVAVKATIGKAAKDRATPKSAAKKAVAKKVALKKVATKKVSAKKATTKKAAVKKTAAKKVVAKKAAVAKKSSAKPASKKVVAKKATAKKAAVKKSAVKKAVAKKAAVKKTSARKPAAPRKSAS